MKFTLKAYWITLVLLLCIVSCVPTTENSSAVEMPMVDFSGMSPEDLARAYIEARQDYSIERIKPILAENVEIIENGTSMTLEDVASFLRYAEAVGLNWDIVSCDPKVEGSTSEISCPIKLRSNVSVALGYAPIAGSVFDFVMTDNKIASVNLDLQLSFWRPNVFNQLRGYIQQNHPESISEMFVSGDLIGISDEGIELWRTLSAEFIASLD